MAETSYSSTKRSLGDAVRALGWYRQFREIVLMLFTVFYGSNILDLVELMNTQDGVIVVPLALPIPTQSVPVHS
jgi:hypothetical protein